MNILCRLRGHRWLNVGFRTYQCVRCKEPGFDVSAARMSRLEALWRSRH